MNVYTPLFLGDDQDAVSAFTEMFDDGRYWEDPGLLKFMIVAELQQWARFEGQELDWLDDQELEIGSHQDGSGRCQFSVLIVKRKLINRLDSICGPRFGGVDYD